MIIASCLGLSEKKSVCSEDIQNKNKETRWMVTFCGWDWREKQEDILQKQSLGRVLQKRCSKILDKVYRKTLAKEPFLKKKKCQDVRLQLYLKWEAHA